MNGRRQLDHLLGLDKPTEPPTFYSHAMSLILGSLLAIIAVMVYFQFKTEIMPVGVHIPASQAPELSKVETEMVDFAPIKVFAPESKKILNLPKSTQLDSHAHVIASSKTANDERSHTVTTVIDDQTGEPTTFDRVDPLPWLAVSTKTQIGAFYGIKNGTPTIRVQGEQELLQIKAVHVGVTVSADMQAGNVDAFAGVGAWVRF